jgi:hypothetical protein
MHEGDMKRVERKIAGSRRASSAPAGADARECVETTGCARGYNPGPLAGPD